MGENIRTIIRWLSSVHAPLGRWAPLAGAALLACTHLFHPVIVRVLAYSGSAVFVILIASDIARSFVDTHSFPDRGSNRAPVSLPMQGMRVILSVALGTLYSVLIFAGIGLLMPLIFLPVIFLVCCFIAWRNVSLWYEQGEEFEEALDAEDHRQTRMPQMTDHRAQ